VKLNKGGLINHLLRSAGSRASKNMKKIRHTNYDQKSRNRVTRLTGNADEGKFWHQTRPEPITWEKVPKRNGYPGEMEAIRSIHPGPLARQLAGAAIPAGVGMGMGMMQDDPEQDWIDTVGGPLAIGLASAAFPLMGRNTRAMNAASLGIGALGAGALALMDR
jgi:hypothetical protein